MIVEKILISDPVRGFTERDGNSKAILNTDIDSLLRYKIQKRKNQVISLSFYLIKKKIILKMIHNKIYYMHLLSLK